MHAYLLNWSMAEFVLLLVFDCNEMRDEVALKCNERDQGCNEIKLCKVCVLSLGKQLFRWFSFRGILEQLEKALNVSKLRNIPCQFRLLHIPCCEMFVLKPIFRM